MISNAGALSRCSPLLGYTRTRYDYCGTQPVNCRTIYSPIPAALLSNVSLPSIFLIFFWSRSWKGQINVIYFTKNSPTEYTSCVLKYHSQNYYEILDFIYNGNLSDRRMFVFSKVKKRLKILSELMLVVFTTYHNTCLSIEISHSLLVYTAVDSF